MLLAEWTLELEERFPGIYKDFPNIKVTVTGLDMIQQNNESPVLVKLKHIRGIPRKISASHLVLSKSTSTITLVYLETS